MSSSPVDRQYESALDDAVTRLGAEGYLVEVNPDGATIGVPDAKIDYLARRGNELVIGEIKYRNAASTRDFERLAARMRDMANARLELTWLGLPLDVHSEAELSRMAKSAEHLIRENATAALLLAWAALEGALIKSAPNDTDSPGIRLRTGRRRIAEMASLGEISGSQHDRLTELAHMRNRIAHGEFIIPVRDQVEYVVSAALALSAGELVSVDQMVEWFAENYKDPADGVPYDGREGGYIYTNGGPFKAEDVLIEQFEMMPRLDILDAVDQIESDGTHEWVRREDY